MESYDSASPSGYDYKNSTSPVDNDSSQKKHTRRPVACKNCHSLKVKCTPSDENNPSSPCVRCLSTKKKCEINLNQPRKRRKKAEIEEERERLRLQALSEAKVSFNGATEPSGYKRDPRNIGALGGGTATCGIGGIGSYPESRDVVGENENIDPSIQNGHGSPDESDNGIMGSKFPANISNGVGNGADAGDTVAQLQNQINQLKTQVEYYKSKSHVLENKPAYIQKEDLQHELKILSKNSGACFTNLSGALKQAASQRAGFIQNSTDKVDLISKGIITVEEAEIRLQLYRSRIYPNFPYIDVDDNITVEQFAQKEPYLFNGVMAVASVVIQGTESDENVCQIIEIEATRHLLIQVVIAGNKTEELLKTAMLLGFWYNTPELVKHRRFHLLNALAISMLHDLGIVAKPDDKKPMLADHLVTLQQTKIVMLLYISTVSTCLILRRAVYVQWTPYVEECCKFLENSGKKELQNLATFSRLNHLLEKIHNVVHCSDNTVENMATNYVLKDFSTQLIALKVKLSEDDHAILAYYYAVEAYLHEPLLSQVTGINEEGGQLFFREDAIRAIAKSTTACIQCLEEFSKLGSAFIATLPLAYVSRMIYTAGILLRLRYLILSVPLRIEKSLMPVDAIHTVQKSNMVFIESSKTHCFNFFLKKTSLMLQLFIQIYANQVQGLLKSHDHGLISFKDHDNEVADYLLGNKPNSNPDDSVALRDSRVSLDVLSYAASLKKELHVVNELSQKVKNSASNSSSPSTKTPTSQSGYPQSAHTPISSFNGVGSNSPFGRTNVVPNFESSDLKYQSYQQPYTNTEGPQLETHSNLHVVENKEGVSPDSAIASSNSFFGVPGFEELDQSFYNIGEEYWSDIVNPNSNNFNLEGKGVPSSDVFFMT